MDSDILGSDAAASTSTSDPTWPMLPSDVVELTSTLCPQHNITAIRKVCEPWRESLDSTCLTLSPHQLELATIAKRFTSIRELDLSNCVLDVESSPKLFLSISTLRSCTSLRMPTAVRLPSAGIITRNNGHPTWYDIPGGWPLPKLRPLSSLTLSGITTAGIASLEQYSNLSSLKIDGVCEPCDDWSSALTEAAPQLASLAVMDSTVGDEELADFAQLRRLTSLVLGHAGQVTDAGVRRLAALARLKRLHLPGSGVACAGTIHLCMLTQLQQLDLSSSMWITDRGIATLSLLPQLTALNLSGCSNVTERGLQWLTALRGLQALLLYQMPELTAGVVSFITTFRQLHTLGADVPRAIWLPTPGELRSLALLARLHLASCSTQGLVLLGKHPGVTSLSLTSASISAGGFFALGGLAGLRSLAISFAEPLNMEGGCGGSLRRLTQLTRLVLHSQSLRHDELLLAEYISALSNLQALELSSASLGPSSLATLARLTALASLTLGDCPHWGDDTMALLARSLTGLTELRLKLHNAALFCPCLSGSALHSSAVWCGRRSSITAAGLARLAGLQQLHSLWLVGSHGMEVTALAALASAPRLKWVYVSSAPGWQQQVQQAQQGSSSSSSSSGQAGPSSMGAAAAGFSQQGRYGPERQPGGWLASVLPRHMKAVVLAHGPGADEQVFTFGDDYREVLSTEG